MTDMPAICPSVFYKDPDAAIDWLARAFGFELSLLLTDDAGKVAHAEMTYLGCGLKIGAEWEGPQIAPARMRSPASLEGMGTQFVSIDLPDGVDAHYEQALAAGARISQPPEDQFYGARTYRALDPEGHVWVFRQTIRQVSNAEMEQATGLTVKVG